MIKQPSQVVLQSHLIFTFYIFYPDVCFNLGVYKPLLLEEAPKTSLLQTYQRKQANKKKQTSPSHIQYQPTKKNLLWVSAGWVNRAILALRSDSTQRNSVCNWHFESPTSLVIYDTRLWFYVQIPMKDCFHNHDFWCCETSKFSLILSTATIEAIKKQRFISCY